MKRGLSNASKYLLECFIDSNNLLIKAVFDFKEFKKFLYGGAPKGFYNSFYNLQKSKHIVVKEKNNNKFIYLTKKGKKIVTKLLIKTKIKKQKWDGQWRILIFDIPENKRRFRDNMRQSLLNLGFIKLQKSVWITPYDIIDDLYEIIPGFREGDWFEYVEAKHISSEKRLKDLFGLK
ncbi:MAG: CRISPR-associated endonuclease Cas2 [Patescibacteria group bacterium]|nr:CRISPR-associated endonuclease Cas2 [Patescibacteria group bacterium]